NRANAETLRKSADAMDRSPQASAIRKLSNSIHAGANGDAQRAAAQLKEGTTDDLKSGIESLSTMSLDNVKAHYTSPERAQGKIRQPAGQKAGLIPSVQRMASDAEGNEFKSGETVDYTSILVLR